MTKYVHIVYVHPVENGEPNLHKVKKEIEFNVKEDADDYIRDRNSLTKSEQAVYVGRVNDATGELE